MSDLTETIAEATRAFEDRSSGLLRHMQWHEEMAAFLLADLTSRGYSIRSDKELPPVEPSRAETVGYVVGSVENDVVLRLTLGDSEASVHGTLDEAEAELVQVWAEGTDESEVFEIRSFSARRR